jgi:hypothetical protein
MSDEERLAQFMETVLARPLPQNPMARVRTLAKEMAEGAALSLWNIYLYTFRGQLTLDQETLIGYLEKRWGTAYFFFSRVISRLFL